MRLLPVLAISIASLTLVGCSTTTPQAIPTSSAVEQAPAFASDEEALAAAQAAYAEYLSVSDQIARDGGSNPERLKTLLSEDLFRDQVKTYEDIQSQNLHAVGESKFSNFKLMKNASSAISNYVCLDVSQIRVQNSAGEDVTPEGRPSLIPLALDWSVSNQGLVMNKSEVWTGANFCL